VLSDSPADYPDRIRQLRKRHGLTQVRLAELLGVSFATVNRWENGQSRPSPLAWQRIGRAEEQAPAGLVDGAKPPHQSRLREAPARYEVADAPPLDVTSDPEHGAAIRDRSPGLLVAEAELGTSEIQGLAEQVAEIKRLAVGLNLRYHLRVELGRDPPPSETTVAGINEILKRTSPDLKLQTSDE
jgi:transcriptional regulator with XRE-family HTH domain